jgi:biofilm PGA synthesis N-glycosyltransferase PgaC
MISAYLTLQSIRFFLYLFLANFNHSKEKKTRKPKISIIIPAYNEHVGIADTIKSVKANKYRKKEIIVVNDGSTDNTLAIIKKIRGIKVIDKANGGKFDALNKGIEVATGDVIVTIDADCYLDSKAIANVAKHFGTGIDALAGKVVIGNKQKLVGLAQYFEYAVGTQMNLARGLLGSIFILPGAITAFKKEIFDNGLHFSGDSKTEDFDFSLGLLSHSYKIAYAQDCICYTEGASDLSSLIKQRVRWRHGGLLTIKKNIVDIYKNSTNTYLKFVEIPLMLVGMLEVLITPIIFYIIYTQVSSWAEIVIMISIMPIFSVIFVDYKSTKEVMLSLLMIPMIQAMTIVEFVAMLLSIKKLIFRQDVIWNNWQRTGLFNQTNQ